MEADPMTWETFELRLAACVSTLTDEQDEIVLLLPGDAARTLTLRGAIEGDGVTLTVPCGMALSSQDPALPAGLEGLVERGWHQDSESEVLEQLGLPVDHDLWLIAEHPCAAEVATEAVHALRDVLAVPAPDLLVATSEGPHAQGAAVLGLTLRADVPTELAADDVDPEQVVLHPSGRPELHELVGAVVEEFTGLDATLDPDADYVLTMHGQQAYVRVWEHLPVVEVFARVAHGVRSRRHAAVEAELLNRKSPWVTWLVDHDGQVMLRSVMQADPFVPMHLERRLTLFQGALEEHRDDLVFRSGGKVA